MSNEGSMSLSEELHQYRQINHSLKAKLKQKDQQIQYSIIKRR